MRMGFCIGNGSGTLDPLHFAHGFFTLNQEWYGTSLLCEYSKIHCLEQKLQDKTSLSVVKAGSTLFRFKSCACMVF